MRPRRGFAGDVVEIACDESGSEGENLIGANTDVFAHAGVRLTVAEAAGCVGELRERIRSPALEYKANHLLRSKHRTTLAWLLGPSGPLLGAAGVLVADKALFAAGKVVDLLVDQVPYPGCLSRRPDARALALHRAGTRIHGVTGWTEFLRSFTDLLRTSPRRDGTSPAEFFARAGQFAGARAHVEELRARLLADPRLVPPLDPLMPALVDTVAHWRPTAVVHDEQPSLTPERLDQLLGPGPELRFVDSRTDPRVQVADFLAGAARRIAEDHLHGHGDAELTGLLRPYVLPASVWSAWGPPPPGRGRP
ncbi:DUF3800 domain-containing protein [Amycolatopsis sp. PS_44_ISF1]|uniref:DUF3800 domain-containing protein n=1 Tax=Amycolatopsis sp. PS_44_ISF1 TaxID=2974917 RepID=UPI0028DFB39A|nr:DUF3800 domain-containing protein [Amycolatopsis sp. PS_44_ISF1]MDT8911830.1 DUF3800 domain-containing protein [Amycolatopsis sp. PS_44_ISF1]